MNHRYHDQHVDCIVESADIDERLSKDRERVKTDNSCDSLVVFKR